MSKQNIIQTKLIVQSPGRINLIGEHTDYNDGFVLPAAVDKRVVLKIQLNNSHSKCKISATNINKQYEFDLNDFSPLEKGSWENYLLGVIRELQKTGAKLQGFDAEFSGNVPIGSGMSSSAALECSFAYGLNKLFDLKLDKWQLAKAAQMAEHTFVGVKCGIMDSFASIFGKKNHVMLLDCRSLEHKYFPFDLKDYEILLLNTNVSHALGSSEYNTRREECEFGVEIIRNKFAQVESLRDVSLEMLHSLVSEMPQKIYHRCHHVITENSRVLEATKALSKNNYQRLGQLIYESHFSLQKDYEVSCPELDFLVESTLKEEYILGARMMGGGFGGCTLNLIEKQKTTSFIEFISKSYHQKFGFELTPINVSIEGGASLWA